MRTRLSAPFLAAFLMAPHVAQAQSREDVARADAMFNAAKALLDAGQYTDACPKFAESKRLAPGLGVTLYLADCYEHIGRTASAWAEFRAAEGLARARNDKRADVARDRARTLETTLNRLTITVSATIARSGLQVLRDGVLVPEDEWGLAVPVDPGDHVVVVSAPGRPTRTMSAHVGADARTATVRIDALEDVVTPSPSAATPAAASAPPSTPQATLEPALPGRPEQVPASNTGSVQRWFGLGLAGAGVVGVGVGSVFGFIAMSKRDQSNGSSGDLCNANDQCGPSGLSLRQDAISASNVANIGFIAGAVALAGGIVLYLTAPASAKTVSVTVAPTTSSNGGGAFVQGAF